MKKIYKRIYKAIIIAIFVIAVIATMSGCRQATRVSYNVSKEADAFNVQRRLTVINARTDTILLDMTGRFALKNSATNELEIICETAEGEYKKNYVYLNEYTIYVVEDISGADVSPYHYEVNFLPQMLDTVDITFNK